MTINSPVTDAILEYSYGKNTPNTTYVTMTSSEESAGKWTSSMASANALRYCKYYTPTDVDVAVSHCLKYDKSSAFASAIGLETFSTVTEVYEFNTSYHLTNGELTDGIRDITGVIRNAAINLDGTDWSGSRVIQLEQQYTGAPDNYFIDAYDQTLNTNQTIYGVPAGTYIIKAATRAEVGVSGTLYCNDGTSEIGKVNQITNVGNSGGELGNGWSWSTMTVTLTEPKNLQIGFWTNATGTGKWAGCDDWHMYRIESVSPTIGTYATFASDYALDFGNATGVKAYYATNEVVNDGKINMTLIEGSVPAGTGLFLQRVGEEPVSIPVVASSTTVMSGNLLKRGTGVVKSVEDGVTCYVLAANQTSGVGFYKLDTDTGVEVATNKAYLELPASTNASRLAFVFNDGEATGIKNVAPVYAENEDAIYNLSGQRVSQPKKGLYVVGGKKVMVK